MRTKADENSIISQSEFFQLMSDEQLQKLVSLTTEDRKIELEEQKILKLDLKNRKLRVFNFYTTMLMIVFIASIYLSSSQVIEVVRYGVNENAESIICVGIIFAFLSVSMLVIGIDADVGKRNTEFSFMNAMIKYLEENPKQSDQEPAVQYLQLSKEKELIEERLKKVGRNNK